MINIQIFEFNPIRVNTYVLYDETGEAVIIDPGCYGSQEEVELSSFISLKKLKPKYVINTHVHTDHILGNHFVIDKYKTGLLAHKDSDFFLNNAKNWSEMLGFRLDYVDFPTVYIEENDLIKFGNSVLKVLHTPGHADGSVCLVNEKQKFVITGDVLFSDSIGRTDLPTGDFDLLKKNIINKLYTLDDDYVVFPGHGPSTTIGSEKHSNPFISINE